jgi:hypothetical protein
MYVPMMMMDTTMIYSSSHNDLTTMYIYRLNAGYAQLNELFFKETILAIMNYKERSRHGT